MKVFEIKPNGLCGGVINAIKMIKDALDNPNTPKPIYMFGNLIHNKHVVNSFLNKGIILVKDNYLDFLDTINTGSVIFTAHGISPDIYNKALNIGLNIIDTTCKNVLKIQNKIKEKVLEDNDVLVIGNESHPEVKAYLGISNHVSVYKKGMEIADYSYCVNQTTLVYDEVLKIFDEIKEQNDSVEIHEEVCNATKSRQSALINELDNYECFIVVGDILSNNCKSLKDVVINHGKPCYLIESLNDLNNIDLSKYNNVAITSGASTPKEVLNEIKNALIDYDYNIKYESKLNDEDYLKI